MSRYTDQANAIVVDRYENARAALDFDPGWAVDVNDRLLVVTLQDAAETHDGFVRSGDYEGAAEAYTVLMEVAAEVAQRSQEKNKSGWGFTLNKRGILGAYHVKAPSRAKDDEKWAAHEAKKAARAAKTKSSGKKSKAIREAEEREAALLAEMAEMKAQLAALLAAKQAQAVAV